MKLQRIEDILSGHAYPGRGILLGRSADNRKAVTAYFIMGRSENSTAFSTRPGTAFVPALTTNRK